MTTQFSPLQKLEAILFANDTPIAESTLQQWLGSADVRKLLATLEEHYKDRGIRLVCVEGNKWAMRTPTELSCSLTALRKPKRGLSKAALETLAICAYHQPVTRHDIEAIRGTRVAPHTLELLMKLGWMTAKGRRNTPGRPLMFVTTTSFLDHFGLGSPRDLPGFDELATLMSLSHQPADDNELPFEAQAPVADPTPPPSSPPSPPSKETPS
ncbi:MAG: SMC-Scp complex subunit ScpB [Alphaproteobacteria bacterium GM202ARS2]|nr:SMC-Scp complex subunit ScpB [Alphaproteobacteria bacterium GM202ARS2]